MSFADAGAVFRLVVAASALAQLVPAAQLIVSRHELSAAGLLRWPARWTWLPAALGGVPSALFLAGTRIVCAAATAVALWNGTTAVVPLGGLALVSVALALRVRWGLTAAEDVWRFTNIAACAAEVVGTPRARDLCLLFLAAQLSVLYFAAGWSKMRARGWWDGTFVQDVAGTASFGDAGLATFLRHRPRLGRAIGRAVVCGELAFPLALLLPPPLAAGMLAVAALGHLAAARFMGLNVFVGALPVVYPAVMFANLWVRRAWMP
jgi:hypothetical protein